MDVDRHLQPLAGNYLEDIAGADIFHAFPYRIFKFLLRKIRFVSDVHRPKSANIHRFQVAWPGREFVHQAVDPQAGVLIGLGQIDPRLIHPGHRHDHDRLGHVVEDHHLIVKGEGQIGDLPIIRGNMGQMFVVTHGVVPGVSDGSAIKGGQFRQMNRTNCFHPVA